MRTGGFNADSMTLKCRKLDFYGDAGDFYFEQPSISVVESGLWQRVCSKDNNAGSLPRITRIETISRSSDAIDAIRFTYTRQQAAVNN